MKRIVLFLLCIFVCIQPVSASEYDEYLFAEPVVIGEIRADSVGDLLVHDMTAETVVHSVDGKEITEIIVRASSVLSPLVTVLTQDGAYGYELNRATGKQTGTVQGLTDSYRIECEITTTLHFLFYKDRHVYSTGQASVKGNHRRYRVLAVGGGKTDSEFSEVPFEEVLYADGFDKRLETAADIGYNARSCDSSFVTKYTVRDDSGKKVCVMSVAAPEKNRSLLGIFAGLAGTAGLGLMLFAQIRRRKKG
ncbi:MAG: hypothetical protein IJC71_07595 [Clostridia bacterium]|nr:hypothetical protein [Clostridia bacterium]